MAANQVFVESNHMQRLDSSVLQSTIPELLDTEVENTQDIEQVWEELLSIPELQVIIAVSVYIFWTDILVKGKINVSIFVFSGQFSPTSLCVG